MMLLCLDGGTTNTRMYLMDGKTVADSEWLPVGSSSPDNSTLKQGVKTALAKLLKRNGLRENDGLAIVASGMVTSELGLYEVPHLVAPVGIEELAKGIRTVTLPEITTIPFWFIPGVRNNDKEPDRMRGEETECIGLLQDLPEVRSVAVVLPGTHNKLILSENGKITRVTSMMSGELLSAIRNHTVLAYSLPKAWQETVDPSALLEGAETCKMFGLTEAIYRIRNVQKAGTRSENWLNSYLAGCVLYCDIVSLRANSRGLPLLIGGNRTVKEEMTVLCRAFLPNKILTVSDAISQNAAAIGQTVLFQKRIAEERK